MHLIDWWLIATWFFFNNGFHFFSNSTIIFGMQVYHDWLKYMVYHKTGARLSAQLRLRKASRFPRCDVPWLKIGHYRMGWSSSGKTAIRKVKFELQIYCRRWQWYLIKALDLSFSINPLRLISTEKKIGRTSPSGHNLFFESM